MATPTDRLGGPDPISDAVESCADALLTTSGLLLMLSGKVVSTQAAREVAIDAIDLVIARSELYGGKPR
jgi:hypothetical protein